MEGLFNLGLTVALLSLGYFMGHAREKRHYASLRSREAQLRHVMVVTLRKMPGISGAHQATLVTGAVCISIDYFKRFSASLRFFFGGRVSAYETIIDRARREAILRMKELAHAQGYEAVICVRLETARIASSRNDGKGTAAMEVVAYGTAVRFEGALMAPESA
jgi:uncharacterized protein YbjQ (UPF0145 family)